MATATNKKDKYYHRSQISDHAHPPSVRSYLPSASKDTSLYTKCALLSSLWSRSRLERAFPKFGGNLSQIALNLSRHSFTTYNMQTVSNLSQKIQMTRWNIQLNTSDHSSNLLLSKHFLLFPPSHFHFLHYFYPWLLQLCVLPRFTDTSSLCDVKVNYWCWNCWSKVRIEPT